MPPAVYVRSKDGKRLGHFESRYIEFAPHNGVESVQLRSRENPVYRLMFPIAVPGSVPTIELDDPQNWAGFIPAA